MIQTALENCQNKLTFSALFAVQIWCIKIATNLFSELTLKLPWVTQTEFLIPYQYNIKQTSDEYREKYHLGITSWSDTKFSELTS